MNGSVDQLIPPNTVDFSRCLSLSFTQPIRESCLLVVKNNIIEIYRISTSGHLYLHAKHSFAARIESIEILPNESESDRILLSFSQAKLSILEFNATLNDFITKSLHFYEREEYKVGEYLEKKRPKILIDPESRLISMRVYSSFLALIPTNFYDQNHINHTNPSSVQFSSSVLSFTESIDPKLVNVTDLTFLPGYFNPTLAILYDSSSLSEHESLLPTDALRSSAKNLSSDTKALMIVSIEIKSKPFDPAPSFQFTVINNIAKLPWDCQVVFPVDKPLGGVFLPFTNGLFWCDTSSLSPPSLISTNPFSQLQTNLKPAFSLPPSLQIPSLSDSHLLLLRSSKDRMDFLLASRNGQKFILQASKSGRSLGHVSLDPINSSTPHLLESFPVSSLTLLDSFIFVASDSGSCQLFKVSELSTVPESSDPDIEDDDPYLMMLKEEEAKIKDQKFKSNSGSIGLELVDELVCLGPIIDMTVGTIYSPKPIQLAESSEPLELVVLAGAFTDSHGKPFLSSINILSQTIAPTVKASFTLPDTLKIWTIIDETFTCTRFLIASGQSSTLVLKTTREGQLVEMEESDFFLEGSTFYCAPFLRPNHSILQIHQLGMRVLDMDGRLLRQASLPFSNRIKRAETCLDKIYVLLDDGKFLSFDSDLTALDAFNLDKSVETFQCDCDLDLLFIASDDGCLEIFSLQTGYKLFSNPFFDRIPPILLNRINEDAPVEMIKISNILSLHTLHGSFVKNSCFLLVSYSQNGFVGLASYRINLSELGFFRLSNNLYRKNRLDCLQPFLKSPTKNSILLQLDPSLIILITVGKRNFPRVHRFRYCKRFSSDSVSIDSSEVLSMTRYDRDSIMLLKSSGLIEIMSDKISNSVDLDWEDGWQLKRIGMPGEDEVASSIVFHSPSRTFVVTCSKVKRLLNLPQDEYASISDNAIFQEVEDSIKSAELFMSMPNTIYLLHPLTWTFIDKSMPLAEDEVFTCMKTLELSTHQTATGSHPHVVLGTAYQRGEDRPTRGRILVYDIAEVVPEPGRPETDRKLRLKGITEMKGPVFSMANLTDGHLAVSLGAKVLVSCFEDDEKLSGVAFYDLGTCSVALASIKSFLTCADLTNSLSLLAFQSEPSTRLHLISRDFGQCLQSQTTEFFVSASGYLFILTGDSQGGLHFFTYAPNNLTSNAGQRLLDRGSFFFQSAPITKMIRLPSPNNSGGLAVLLACQDGSINLLLPLELQSFRRLFLLELRLAALVPGRAGLSYRVCRQVPLTHTIRHFLPLSGYLSIPTPSSLSSQSNFSQSPASLSVNQTLIPSHLPVSNSIIDGVALKRFLHDPLFDCLTRQSLSNRFALDFSAILTELSGLIDASILF